MDLFGSVASMAREMLTEIVQSPLNLILVSACAFVAYKIYRERQAHVDFDSLPTVKTKQLEPMAKRDFTVAELRHYDGTDACEGRILIAINGKVFDVSRGRNFYGPDGPYGVFAGHDATRGLGTFSISPQVLKDEYDDVFDLTPEEMEAAREWESQFEEKYPVIGRLLRPGEEHTDYDEDEEVSDVDTKDEKN